MFVFESAVLWFAVRNGYASALAHCCGATLFLAGIFSAANGIAALLFCFSNDTNRVLRLSRNGIVTGLITIGAAAYGTLLNEMFCVNSEGETGDLPEELAVIAVATAVTLLSVATRKISYTRVRAPLLPREPR